MSKNKRTIYLKKYLALLKFALLFAGFASAQSNGRIVGRVLNHEMDPVSGATVQSIRATVAANSTGRFSIHAHAGDTLSISAIGFSDTAVVVPLGVKELIIMLGTRAGTMDEVVVSGGMREVTRMNSPIPVESYSARFFRKNPVPNLFESLSILNGVQPQINCNVCNTGDIHINGMEGPYTMVLIDGMPIVSSLSTVYGLMGIPSGMIKRIEVVKGPSSTLYGSEAVAGLINVITQEAGSGEKFFADVMATSFGEYNAEFAGRIKAGKWNGLIGLNGFLFDNKKDVNEDNFTDVTLQKRISLFQKWELQRVSGKPFSFAARIFSENRWGGELQWKPSLRGSDSIYAETISTNRFELFGNYGLPIKKLPLLFEYSYNYHYQDAAYGSSIYLAGQHTAFGQLRWSGLIGKHNLISGVPMRYIRYDDNTPATEDVAGKTKPDHSLTTGLFVQDEWDWNDKWTLLTGLRTEWNNTHGWIPSPRVALRFKPDVHQTFRFSAGNGFRVVNLFTEDHLALSGARDLQILSTLKPEKSWNLNLNYSRHQSFERGTWYLDASAFYTYFTNKIIADYDTDPTLIIYDNLDGYAVSRGISVNSDLSFQRRWKMMTGFSLMEVFSKQKNELGKQTREEVLFAPRWTANYAWSYTVPAAALTIDLTGKTYSSMRLPVVPNDFREEWSRVFTILNLQLTKKMSSKWEIYGGVKNLLNFMPKNPILHPDDPFDKPGGKYFDDSGEPRADTNPNGYRFDPSYNYAPMQGIRGFVGTRIKF